LFPHPRSFFFHAIYALVEKILPQHRSKRELAARGGGLFLSTGAQANSSTVTPLSPTHESRWLQREMG